MEQFCLTDVAFSEQLVFDLLKPILLQTLEMNFVPAGSLSCNKRKAYSSVKCLYPIGDNALQTQREIAKHFDSVAFRIKVLKTKSYFEIPAALHEMVPEENRAPVCNEDKEYVRLDFESTQEGALKYADYLCRIVDARIDTMPKDFACCSRVEECSNVRKCVNPRPDLAIGCGYRRNLKRGIIFYGINKNA